ncbi:MAG: hypothetical protein IPH43_07800 [Xanthomonadales bacterium]|jgi:hypothetical protein|uniref:hypothetical protein n=1 Tax=Dokdonella sp. TaxID=2291710 RepID=UPI002C16D7D8|nr:hypothetical protein [Xanthomonadales bacterium]MBK7012573.1 hypothetical protein [Xanthomonadales bacterium]MBK7210623.1 hypothetical protein [Xanthomonadales bacterium]HQX64957.1 hypothetical protein [Dokdonella sp.]HQY55131.1 hypothetical protein [Dokdonella sp.]
MNSSDLSFAEATADFSRPGVANPTPQLGDVIDSIEDAKATFGRIVRNETEILLADVRGMIRAKPLGAVAMVGAVAYVLGCMRR